MFKSTLLLTIVLASATLLVSKAALGETPSAAKNQDTTRQLSLVNERMNQTLQQNIEIQRTVIGQTATIASLQLDQIRVKQQLQAEQRRFEEAQRQLAVKADDDHTTAIRNDIAMGLNIFGMILGALGGVLLAGSQLSARQERISDMRVTKGYSDIALHDITRQKILDFYGLLGGIFIATGFAIQFIGALVGAPLPWFAVAALGLIAIVFVLRIFMYFLAYTPDQTSAEKAAAVMYNVRRHIIQPIWKFVLHRRVVTCQVCLQKLTILDTKVWWLDQGNTSEYPYLYPPYAFHYGHDACLPKISDYQVYFDGSDKLRELRLVKTFVKDFLEQELPRLRTWCVEYRRHWEEKGKRIDGETSCEEELRHVEKDISPLMSG